MEPADMVIDTPDDLWSALAVAAKQAEATGKAASLPEGFGGCMVVVVALSSPLAVRVQKGILDDDRATMLPPQPPACVNCRFWQEPMQRCAVRSPEVFHPMGTVWPVTLPTEWCGEWEAHP